MTEPKDPVAEPCEARADARRAGMPTNRLEAFSDGVIAIIITIMVLELKAPHEATFEGLLPIVPTFLSYVLSFIYVGIFWNNHHHLMFVVRRVDGGLLWANLHLLFWMSLVPFTTAWMDETHFAAVPVALYGAVLMACAIAYAVMVSAILASEGRDSLAAAAIGRDRKGKLSIALYLVAIALAFVSVAAAEVVYACVAAIWLIPDRRITHVLAVDPRAAELHGGE